MKTLLLLLLFCPLLAFAQGGLSEAIIYQSSIKQVAAAGGGASGAVLIATNMVNNSFGVTSKTTNSLASLPADTRLVLVGGTEASASAEGVAAGYPGSTPALTWSLITNSSTANSGAVWIWVAYLTNSASVWVTNWWSTGPTCQGSLYAITNAEIVHGGNKQLVSVTSAAAPSGSLTSRDTGSVIIAGCADYNATAGASAFGGTVQIVADVLNSGKSSYRSWCKTNLSGSVTMNMTAPTQIYGLGIVEIRGK